jgi:hypothetical protein
MYYTKHGYLHTAYFCCTNSACDSWRRTVEVDIVDEPDTGAKYLRCDDDRFCQDCGHEMEET